MLATMQKQILVANEKNSTVQIPSEFYGMEVEVVFYPIIKRNNPQNDINSIFDKNLCLFKDFKFNRDKANDYE